MTKGLPPAQGLYDPQFERDSCGVGFICHIKGTPSHKIVSDALLMLENMNHRGACGCEEDSGDGAGILVRTPDAFLRKECRKLGIALPPAGQYACGMIFLPQDMVQRDECERIVEQVISDYGMTVLGCATCRSIIATSAKRPGAPSRRSARFLSSPMKRSSIRPILIGGCIWFASLRRTRLSLGKTT